MFSKIVGSTCCFHGLQIRDIGFQNLDDFIDFSISFKDSVFDEITNWIDGFEITYGNSMRFKVKGSATNNFKTGDPMLPDNLQNDLSVSNRPVGDIDIDIEIDKYDEFLYDILTKLRSDLDFKDMDRLNKHSKDIIRYHDGKGMIEKMEEGTLNSFKYREMEIMDEYLGTDAVSEIRNACSQFTTFEGEMINFAFIKPNSPLDMNPKIPLRYD